MTDIDAQIKAVEDALQEKRVRDRRKAQLLFRRFVGTETELKAVEDALQDRRARDRRKADRRMTDGTTQQSADMADIETAFDADRLPNTRGFEPT